MKDKWMNMGYEEEDLKPYVEPVQDWNDRKRIEILEGMGYNNTVVEEALKQQKFDDCYASYLLLGRRNTEVSFLRHLFISKIGKAPEMSNYKLLTSAFLFISNSIFQLSNLI